MIKKTEKTVKLDEIKVNEHNPRQIKQKEMDKLKKSLKDFPEMMQLRPIVVDENGVILGGNMRYQALVASGADSADVIQVEGLTEDQKREFIIKDNVPYGDWDWDALANEWDPDELNDWGLLKKWHEPETDEPDEYSAFVDKFKPKLTTDDCYTPPAVFSVVEEWARDRYKLGDVENIRPFKPGGDYTKEDYTGKVVIDNPPFSIMSEIVRYFLEHGIKFFLFYDARYAENAMRTDPETMTVVIPDCTIVYENGAAVTTCFVTNFEGGKIIVSGGLGEKIKEANDTGSAELTKYADPENLTKCVKVGRLGLKDKDMELVYGLDYMRAKTEVFGGGHSVKR